MSGITYRKRSAFFVTINSIQLNAKAMIFDTTMDTTMNLMVSMVPQSRSKYRKDAGITIRVIRSFRLVSFSEHEWDNRDTHLDNTCLHKS